MQTLTTKSELKAANSIQGTCDAVIVLDQELKVIHGEQSVANMLMLTPSKVQSESETPSKVLIAEEERDRLAEMVHGARSSAMPGPYAAFNTSLKDSAAIPCSVEAMCVKHLQALIRTPPSKAHKCRPGTENVEEPPVVFFFFFSQHEDVWVGSGCAIDQHRRCARCAKLRPPPQPQKRRRRRVSAARPRPCALLPRPLAGSTCLQPLAGDLRCVDTPSLMPRDLGPSSDKSSTRLGLAGVSACRLDADAALRKSVLMRFGFLRFFSSRPPSVLLAYSLLCPPPGSLSLRAVRLGRVGRRRCRCRRRPNRWL
ncbi:unnamed protein product [Prorocentrum cordatum]|uniref:Uncharacterized protein n=1 Tax=Prorocentrum cordatum TaxID=2364126 RepID=A0ABN9XSX5_9DINO|nr:unnamed protein product [Polarella glacialis]